ncbi:MAG TPA: hypothetical protein VEA38_24810 [Terriglobales bacterium]|nr:hypothetical protein [Terriglobales bacterium]
MAARKKITRKASTARKGRTGKLAAKGNVRGGVKRAGVKRGAKKKMASKRIAGGTANLSPAQIRARKAAKTRAKNRAAAAGSSLIKE